MHKKNKKISFAFIVLNWNGKKNTVECLESLLNIDYVDGFDVIVVDNGSEDGSVPFLKERYISKYDHIKLIELKQNTGFTGGHIEGIKHTDARFICLLNNDAVVQKNILTEASKITVALGDNWGAFGGRSYVWNRKQHAYNIWNDFFTSQKIDLITGEAHTIRGSLSESVAPRIVDSVSGACVFINRRAIETVGYLDRSFFAYYEETDLFARFKRCGYEVYYCPSIRYWHRFNSKESSHGESTKHLKNFSSRLILRNQFYFVFKNFQFFYLLRFFGWYYFRFIRSLLLLPFSAENRNFNSLVVSTTLLNFSRIPRLLYQRFQLERKLPIKASYNSSLLAERTRITIVFTFNPKDEILELIKYYAAFNDRVHIRNQDKCSLTFQHRCMKLNVSAKFINAVATACSRTNYTLILNDDQIKPRSILRQIKKLKDTDNPYKKQDDGLIIFNKLFVNNPRTQNFKRSQPIDWTQNIDFSFNNKWLFSKFLNKSLTNYRLVADYLRYRQRQDNKLGLLRAVFGLVKNFPFKPKHTFNTVLIGAEKQRKYNRQSIHNAPITPLSNTKVEDIPVFINCRDRVDSLVMTLEGIRRCGFHNIFLIDNQSSYKSLRHYYNECSEQVILLGENMGHKAPWESLAVKLIAQDHPYVVTDPDVVLSESYSNQTIKTMLRMLDNNKRYVKIGPALSIDDIPDHYQHKKTVQNWEKQFWTKRIFASKQLEAYDAEIDTTFALYRPGLQYITQPSIRLGGEYTAKHLPWYQNSKKPSKEELYYRTHASSMINTWDKDTLPEYLEEYLD